GPRRERRLDWPGLHEVRPRSNDAEDLRASHGRAGYGRLRMSEEPVKQITQRLRDGKISVIEVPAPVVTSDGVLVDVRASLLSAGTERAKVQTGRQSLLGKARSRGSCWPWASASPISCPVTASPAVAPTMPSTPTS